MSWILPSSTAHDIRRHLPGGANAQVNKKGRCGWRSTISITRKVIFQHHTFRSISLTQLEVIAVSNQGGHVGGQCRSINPPSVVVVAKTVMRLQGAVVPTSNSTATVHDRRFLPRVQENRKFPCTAPPLNPSIWEGLAPKVAGRSFSSDLGSFESCATGVQPGFPPCGSVSPMAAGVDQFLLAP